MNKKFIRKVIYDSREIEYTLEQKKVKNLNLRIHRDCSVYVSADPSIPINKIDEFVVSKGEYIAKAQDKFREMLLNQPQEKRYVSGENFNILGKGLRLRVKESSEDRVFSDGVYLYLMTRKPLDTEKKKKIINQYLDDQCTTIFMEIIEEIYPIFSKYGVQKPELKIRKMEARWGSCLVNKGIIILNKRLLETPRNCIEYVVMHEFCHFIHPNHSKMFYAFLTMLMPDWKERKMILEKSAAYGL